VDQTERKRKSLVRSHFFLKDGNRLFCYNLTSNDYSGGSYMCFTSSDLPSSIEGIATMNITPQNMTLDS
jgi:hypothetical protein